MELELKWIVMDGNFFLYFKFILLKKKIILIFLIFLVFALVENGYVLLFLALILKFRLQLKNIVNMKTWITKLIEIYFNDHKNFVLFSFF